MLEVIHGCPLTMSDSYTIKEKYDGRIYQDWEQPILPWQYWLSRFPARLVADPFAGSGVIGVAARRTGRDYLGTEVDPERAAVARFRLTEDR